MDEGPRLSGRTVGVTADRRGDDQVVLFERLGAEVLLGPTIATVKVPDPGLLRRRTEEVIADPPDFLIANTGIGVRTWLEAADDWGLGSELRVALARTGLVARGPKAGGALRSAGLLPAWRSPNEQLTEAVEHLIEVGVSGRRVALQLHGDDGSEHSSRLVAAGATVLTIPVYVWQLPPDPAPAMRLIERTCEGRVDALTFTAGPQIRCMFELAGRLGLAGPLLERLNRGGVVVGCIGPVCATAAAEAGIASEGVVVPANWRLGSLVKSVAEALSPAPG